jgi:hypothetical protein
MHDLTNEQSARLMPPLPPEQASTGCPDLDQRPIIDGSL